VIMNLLSNAVKFTPENGNIYVGARVREGFVEAFVSDSGIGIAPEHKEAVFERFKQISYVQSGKPKGTGLGLAICKEIIEYHKGKIWVESPPPPPDGQEGKGSVFYFTLPFA